MELVKQFNSELSSLYESKPPISKAKMTSITRTAIKAIKLYKHVVQSVEKFIQKCKPEYKVPGLYVIDSIVRQSRHQFGTEKDVFAPRFARNLQQTFIHLFSCPPEDKSKVIRVLNLWQKNSVFDSEVIQPLFDLADPNHPVHKEQAALAPSNGITAAVKPVPPASMKTGSGKKETGTAGWVNQLQSDPSPLSNQTKPQAPTQGVDVNLIQQLQHLQTLLLDQSDKVLPQSKDSEQVKFDKKLLDFDYGEEEDDIGTPAQHHHHQQQQVVAGLDSIGSILSNPEVLRQLQTLQQTLSNPQQFRQQQQLEAEEKLRKMQEMKQQEEEFDKHLAQTVPNLPFADECELKPGGDLVNFPGMDLSQPPPGYVPQQKMMVPSGMMMKPPPSPLEDGEHASSDTDERMGRPGEEGGPAVVVLDSDSPSDSPARGRRRRRRSRSRSRSRSRNKRRRSSSYEEKDWEKAKLREAEKEKERDRKRKGLPPLKKNHLAVCSTTLWIGHLSKLVQQEELSDTFGKFGDIVSIDLIPPRGCAFICMNRRQDAYRALQDLKHYKLQGKAITLAWAPGKGMKGKEYKDYWEVEQGVSYIPWSKLTSDIDLELLEEGGMLDEETFPEWLIEKQKKTKEDDNQRSRSQTSSQAEDDEASRNAELDIPVPAPTIPGFIPLPEGPQPTDIKVSQPPPNMPMSMPPLGMMPPFGLPNVPREYIGLLGPMGMAMGPGLMPNVPLGVPPPGMQGLMGNPLLHQQMLSRMPQPVGSPFNPPPGMSLLGGLSQIPLPGGQDKNKPGLTPMGDPFGDPLMQLPFTLPPQLQMPGLGLLTRTPVPEKQVDESTDENKESSSPTRNGTLNAIRSQFGHPPPQFSPMSLMKIPPPMTAPPPNKQENQTSSDDKDERELKDKDYKDGSKDYKEREKERDRDREYRNKRDRDYRGDRDYRDRAEKDYRERDKEYRDKERERRDRRERSRDREKDDKGDLESKDNDKDRKDDSSKEERSYRDRSDREKGRNRDRERDRDRGRDRGSKWNERDRDRGRERDRDDKRSRDRDRDRSKELKGSGDRDKDRSRSSLERERSGEFQRSGMDTENFQGPGGPSFGSRNEGFHPDGFPSDSHQQANRREGFNNRGPREMFDHRGPPPDGFDPRGPPPDVFDPRGPPPEGFGPRGVPPNNFLPRGPPPDMFGPRGPPPEGFGPRGLPPDGFGPRGPPPDGFGPRGPPDGFDPRGPPDGFCARGPHDGFGPRGPPMDGFGRRGPPPDGFGMRGLPPDAFGPRGPPPDGFGPRGPPEGFNPRGPPPFGPPDGFDPRGPPPDFDGQGPPEGFNNRGPPDGFDRGPPQDSFGPEGPPPEGLFGGPPGEFQPRIRIEFFPRGRGRGLQDSFRGRGARGGGMFSPEGGSGPRGPRPGAWMEGQGPSPQKPGFGFQPRGFTPAESPERFSSPPFEDSGRGRGSLRGRGRGYQGRTAELRREDEESAAPNPKRSSRWSNPSPPPFQPNEEDRFLADIATAEAIMAQASKNESNNTTEVHDKNDATVAEKSSTETICEPQINSDPTCSNTREESKAVTDNASNIPLDVKAPDQLPINEGQEMDNVFKEPTDFHSEAQDSIEESDFSSKSNFINPENPFLNEFQTSKNYDNTEPQNQVSVFDLQVPESDGRRPSFETSDRRPSFETTDQRPSFETCDRSPSFETTDQRPSFESSDPLDHDSSTKNVEECYKDEEQTSLNKSEEEENRLFVQNELLISQQTTEFLNRHFSDSDLQAPQLLVEETPQFEETKYFGQDQSDDFSSLCQGSVAEEPPTTQQAEQTRPSHDQNEQPFPTQHSFVDEAEKHFDTDNSKNLTGATVEQSAGEFLSNEEKVCENVRTNTSELQNDDAMAKEEMQFETQMSETTPTDSNTVCESNEASLSHEQNNDTDSTI